MSVPLDMPFSCRVDACRVSARWANSTPIHEFQGYYRGGAVVDTIERVCLIGRTRGSEGGFFSLFWWVGGASRFEDPISALCERRLLWGPDALVLQTCCYCIGRR